MPAPLAAFGLPGCNLWIASSSTQVLVHGGGTALLPLTIPAAPWLAGLTFAAQALSLDAAAPSGIGAVSNAVVLRVH